MRRIAMRVLAMGLLVSMAGLVEAGTTTITTTANGTIVGFAGAKTGSATGYSSYTKVVVKNSFGVTLSKSSGVQYFIKNVFFPDGTQIGFVSTPLVPDAVLNNAKAQIVVNSGTGSGMLPQPKQGSPIVVNNDTGGFQIGNGIWGALHVTVK